MASKKKIQPSPPPSGPALCKPVLGALLMSMPGAGCGDDSNIEHTTGSESTSTTGDGTTDIAPMPAPTDTNQPPMEPPTGDTAAEVGETTEGDDTTGDPPPMPPPTGDDGTTGDDMGSTGEDSGTSEGSESSGELPPMPPPMPPPPMPAPMPDPGE